MHQVLSRFYCIVVTEDIPFSNTLVQTANSFFNNFSYLLYVDFVFSIDAFDFFFIGVLLGIRENCINLFCFDLLIYVNNSIDK